MMRWLAKLVFVLITAAGANSATAAAVSFAVTSQPTLTTLGITYTVGGGASLDNSGTVPLVNMTVEGFQPFPGIGGDYGLTSSTVTAQASGVTLQFLGFILRIRNDLLNPPDAIGLLFSDLVITDSSGSTVFDNLLVGVVGKNTWDLAVSTNLANLLANAGIRGAENFVVANVTLPAPIPLPGTLPLVAGALVLLRAFALRCRAPWVRGQGLPARQAV